MPSVSPRIESSGCSSSSSPPARARWRRVRASIVASSAWVESERRKARLMEKTTSMVCGKDPKLFWPVINSAH